MAGRRTDKGLGTDGLGAGGVSRKGREGRKSRVHRESRKVREKSEGSNGREGTECREGSEGRESSEGREVEIPVPSWKEELADTFDPMRQLLVVNADPFRDYRGKGPLQGLRTFLFWAFPICGWVSEYKLSYLVGDVIGGLTISSLAVPQDLAYSALASVPPVNGLYSSFLPPLGYAILGTSRHIAIGPTAVVSLLLGTLLKKHVDPDTAPNRYLRLAFTATFFAGVVQMGMGLLRLGFIIEFLSHAAIVGFMAGAAIIIGLSQVPGMLGLKPTYSTDVVSIIEYINDNIYLFNWRALLTGLSVLLFLLTFKFLAWRFQRRRVLGRVLFFSSALAPLACVLGVLLCVFLTASSKLQPCVKPIKAGVSGISSASELYLTSQWAGTAAAIGTVAGLISLTEAVAIARTFAALKGYNIDGNKEMIALGFGNLLGSLTSSIVTTGSFSRSAVNFSSGGHTMLTNIIMSGVILVVLLVLTPVFQFLPFAVLCAIIIVAVSSLIDVAAMWQIWKADKVDFLVMAGTFLAVVFASVEIGLLVGVCISMFKVLVLVTRPHLAVVGEIPGTGVHRNVKQYRSARTEEGVLALRIDAPVLFTNASFIRDKVLAMTEEHAEQDQAPVTHVILDFTPVPDIDTTGIHSLEQLFRQLQAKQVALGISNPSKNVLRKLAVSGFVEEIGRAHLFMSVSEASKAFVMERATKMGTPNLVQESGSIEVEETSVDDE